MYHCKEDFMKRLFIAATISSLFTHVATAALVTNPNDARTWQGASVGTFAQLYFGANTAVNRQLVIDKQLLDDGIFDPTGYTASIMISNVNGIGSGTSLDTTGTGSFGYTTGGSGIAAGSAIDQNWVQTSGTVGDAVWDLGFQASKAAVFNTIDHGPLPQEAIESTVYLSNDRITWTAAQVERVWLEGFQSNTGILWDGFVYAVGTGTTDTFRYASIIWGGPGALLADGDNEINGILGTKADFTSNVPEPSSMGLALAGGLICWVGATARRRQTR
jgi:hypothetical protein